MLLNLIEVQPVNQEHFLQQLSVHSNPLNKTLGQISAGTEELLDIKDVASCAYATDSAFFNFAGAINTDLT